MADKLIIAYGDSLTEGLLDEGLPSRYAPYTDFLRNLINERTAGSPNPLDVSVENMSVYGGQLVKERGLHNNNIGRVLKKAPDMCIVLAGTNDLGMLPDYGERDADTQKGIATAAEHLFSIYATLKESRIMPVAVTVPPLRVPTGRFNAEEAAYHRKFHVSARRHFNQIIEDYARTNGLLLVDLYAAMSNDEGMTRSEYSTPPDSQGIQHDWVHFNKAGYQRIAEVIFQRAIEPLISHWTGREYQLSLPILV